MYVYSTKQERDEALQVERFSPGESSESDVFSSFCHYSRLTPTIFVAATLPRSFVATFSKRHH